MCSLSSLPFKNPTANHRLNFITNSPRLNLDTDSYRFNFKTTTKNRLNLDTDNDRLNMLHDPNEDDYTLHVRQQPLTARVVVGKDKDRKPVDPPPIIQLEVSTRKDPAQHFLQSPYYFMSCALVAVEGGPDPKPHSLVGTIVSSLHRLKDTNNQDGGFFVFGDLSVKNEGTFRLRFTLFQMQNRECLQITSITSNPFAVHTGKNFPGMSESTFLTRSFSDQGVRLRLRKDSRSMTTRKRNAQSADLSRTTERRSSEPKDTSSLQAATYSPLGARQSNGQQSPADYYTGAQAYPDYGETPHKRQRTTTTTADPGHSSNIYTGYSLPQYDARNYAGLQPSYSSTSIPQNIALTMPPSSGSPYLQAGPSAGFMYSTGWPDPAEEQRRGWGTERS